MHKYKIEIITYIIECRANKIRNYFKFFSENGVLNWGYATFVLETTFYSVQWLEKHVFFRIDRSDNQEVCDRKNHPNRDILYKDTTRQTECLSIDVVE